MTRAALAVFALTFAAPVFAQEKGRKVAFLVGVGAFKHDLTNLGTTPQKDATELGEVLNDGGFEVVTLTDKDATKAGIEGRFKKLMEGKPALAKGDLLLVALSTHGFSLPPAAGRPDQPFLAAHDSKLNKPDTMVSLNGLIADGKSSGATVLYLIDACREVTDVNRGFEPTQVTLPRGTAVLFSCGRGQVSHQPEALKRGLFTHAVLQTLKGERGIKDEVSWSGLVYEVEQAFRSKEFRAMIPPRKPQTPFASAGELSATNLMHVNPLEADYQAYRAVAENGLFLLRDHLKKVAPLRITTWRRHAEKGNPLGQILYGLSFENGFEVEKDLQTAFAWGRKAADSGDVRLMTELGHLLIRSRQGAKAEAEGASWIRKAAEAGHPEAMYHHATSCLYGFHGVKKNEAEAVKWAKMSAEAGYPMGMNQLGLLYEEGRGGLPKDKAEALKWFGKAAELGNMFAKNNLKRLGKE